MPDAGKPATGPLILEQITQLREELREVRETQQRRERQLKNLSEQIDRFLGAELDLTGTLVQVREVLRNTRDGMAELRNGVKDLERTVHGVLELSVSDPQLQERDRAA